MINFFIKKLVLSDDLYAKLLIYIKYISTFCYIKPQSEHILNLQSTQKYFKTKL